MSQHGNRNSNDYGSRITNNNRYGIGGFNSRRADTTSPFDDASADARNENAGPIDRNERGLSRSRGAGGANHSSHNQMPSFGNQNRAVSSSYSNFGGGALVVNIKN